MRSRFEIPGNFDKRHIGVNKDAIELMLSTIGVDTLDDLIDQTVPQNIRLKKTFKLPKRISEYEYLQEIKQIASKNKLYKSFIGLGYYNTITPSPILRNILENPGWYTQYTPYQAEIAQGRLEALLNFQTVVSDLTGMEIANASLLDEGTAAAEAMAMFYAMANKGKNKGKVKFWVSEKCFPQTISVLQSRANPLGIQLEITSPGNFEFDETSFGFLVQYPDGNGNIRDNRALIEKAHDAGCYAVVAADLLSLTLLTPPGEQGADAVVGTTQRFGVPLGFGGPHAAYFACRDAYKRVIPGRIIGVSIDSNGNPALRMALQTREQHIRREKATSNICTAQALLAIIAGMYAIYHGPDGLRDIAERIHLQTRLLERELVKLGFQQLNEAYFDTLKIAPNDYSTQIQSLADTDKINLRYFEDGAIGISLNETVTPQDLNDVLRVFAKATGRGAVGIDFEEYEADLTVNYPEGLQRSSSYLEHPVFHQHRSETELMRYMKRLENRDLSLCHSMIPLGSCTMKLNAATELIPITWPEFGSIHPFVPKAQATGYYQIISELEHYLCEITGFTACSLQPNSGAQGELTGLRVIDAYHRANNQSERNIVLIPSSAHGTNPASAIMAGMKVVVVKCDNMGNIDVEDLHLKATQHRDHLSALMVTYPSTHGVFEESIIEICAAIHEHGGLVYMDGANMNAQVGLTNPASIGADVCHLNLHKTFSIPHGGGGPGMGPICVNDKLKDFLPNHPLVETGGEQGIQSVNAAPFGSASILLISYAYIRMLGRSGGTHSTKTAILNANYLKDKLKEHYSVLYVGANDRVAHELILDFRPFKHKLGIEVEDIAKRLIDYGFHAPTVSFPVSGTMMIEPTESESKEELDRFVTAMIGIRNEIDAIEKGLSDQNNNVLKNAPHTIATVMSDDWDKPYSRSEAAFPVDYLQDRKFWPHVGRINNPHGDRNLICTCPPMEDYMEA